MNTSKRDPVQMIHAPEPVLTFTNPFLKSVQVNYDAGFHHRSISQRG